MTEKLRTLMDERAAAPDFAVPDPALLRAAGLRRRRRRHAVVGGAGLVTTAAVATLLLALTSGTPGTDAGPDVANDSQDSTGPTTPTAGSYAIGSVIHDDGRRIDVGRPVRAYVATTAGYVAADEDGRIWSVTGDRVEQVGTTPTGSTRLVSDPQESVAAWLDVESSSVVALDQADGTVSTYDVQLQVASQGERLVPGHLYALDGGVVHVRDGADAVAIDLATGARTLVEAGVRDGTDVLDAAGGRVAYASSVSTSEEGRLVNVGTSRADTGPGFAAGYGEVALSPDAAFLAVLREDEGAVYDTATGREVDLDLDGFYEAYAWADATTLLVLAGTEPDGGGAGRLLGCDVVEDSCEVVVADLGVLLEVAGRLVLPSGTE